MTYEEFSDAIDGLHAYDTGCTDSGIQDEVLRARVIAQLKADDSMAWLTRHVRHLIAEGQPYTLEDVRGLIEWLSDRMDYDV